MWTQRLHRREADDHLGEDPKNNSTESITTPLESRSNGFAVDDQANSASGSASEQKPTEAPTSSVLARPKRTRQSARRNIPPLAPAGSAMVPLGSEGDPQESAATLPEQPGLLSRVRVVSGARKRAAATRKEPISRVSNQRPSTPPPPTKKVAVAATTTSGPSVVKTEQTLRSRSACLVLHPCRRPLRLLPRLSKRLRLCHFHGPMIRNLNLARVDLVEGAHLV
ncbi:hypothetical protein A0H81_04622 [Grifola frondosa]|uniref:Uncharacterized protein n=1 Tax=Grifola frondosa TaxID=5627 RepID=A0A1C7MEJ6_GRIFR|nr:hypothetical protein A0H81_04622 [Grifola frondosa]